MTAPSAMPAHTPDLSKRLRRNAGWRDERWQCITEPALLTEAADTIEALVEALEAARKLAVSAIRSNCTDLDFDPAEHPVVVKMDAALSLARGEG